MSDLKDNTAPKEVFMPTQAAKFLQVDNKTLRNIESRDPTFPRGKRITSKIVRYDADAVRLWATQAGGE